MMPRTRMSTMIATRLSRHTLRRQFPISVRTFFSNSENNSAWRGIPEMAIGGGILVLVVADQFLQFRDEKERKHEIKKMEFEIKQDKLASEAAAKKSMGKEALYQSIVVQVPTQFGGTKGLKGVRVKDVLDVLEENVGPDHTYSLCRTRGLKEEDTRVGWFPNSYLQKVL
mmetsp:Transcript_26704/g.40953  ORF Transcript_26704/g.40953 Transcript_26704/m.40953 type:complete len:170 (+) Transcript_26704:73-582(+)